MRILKQILVCLSVSLISTAEYCSPPHNMLPASKPASEANMLKTEHKPVPSSNAGNVGAQGNIKGKKEEDNGTIESSKDNDVPEEGENTNTMQSLQSKDNAPVGMEKGSKATVSNNGEQNTRQGSETEGKSKDVKESSKPKGKISDDTSGQNPVPTKNGSEKHDTKEADSASYQEFGNSNPTLYPSFHRTEDTPPKKENDLSRQDPAPMNNGLDADQVSRDNLESSSQEIPKETDSVIESGSESNSDEVVKKEHVSFYGKVNNKMNNAGRQLGKMGQRGMEKVSNSRLNNGTCIFTVPAEGARKVANGTAKRIRQVANGTANLVTETFTDQQSPTR